MTPDRPRAAGSGWVLFLKIYLGSIFAVLLILYVALFAYVNAHQDALIFPAPSNYPHVTPASAGLAFEDLHISVGASEQIHAWWILSTRPTQKVILFLHGNGYTLEQSVTFDALALHAVGANLLMIDYRGYGSSSPGTASESRVDEDARAALHYLVAQRHIPIGDVTIVGRSIGTGIAAQLASENPRADGLVLLSPFTTLNDVARETWFLRVLPLSLMQSHNTFDTLEKIGSIHMPVLLVVGSQDDYTPPWMAQALLARANAPKALFLVPNAGHNDLFSVGQRAVVARLTLFVFRR